MTVLDESHHVSPAQTPQRPQRTLLLFAYYFPPTNESGAKRPFRFVRYLQRHGYRTQVVTASPQPPGSPWKDAREAPDGTAPDWKTRWGALACAAVQRVIPYNDQLPWVAHAVAQAERIVLETRPAAILSTSPPVACHLAAMAMKRKYGLPWVADLRDPVYNNPHRVRLLSRPYDAAVEQMIVRYADLLIANTDSATEDLRRRYPRMAHKIHLIWNGYDPEDPLEPRPIPPRDVKLLLHAGSIYAGRHPGAVLESLKRLIDGGRLDPAKFRIRLIGWLDLSQPWISGATAAALQELGCLEYVPEMVPEPQAIREMAEADYLLLLDGNDSGKGLQVPAKLFQYMRIGRPILASTAKDSPSERILAHGGIPYVAAYPGASGDRMDECLLALNRLPTDPVQPNAWFEERFNAESQTRMLAALLGKIIPGGVA